MADELTPALQEHVQREPVVPRFKDRAAVFSQPGFNNTLPKQLVLQSDQERPAFTGYRTIARSNTGSGGEWTKEMRMHCWMFAIMTTLLLIMIGAMVAFIVLLFADSGTFTKIKRITDTGDFMIQRLNDSGIVESVFFLAETWQTGNYTENFALSLDRAQGNIGLLMDTLENMDLDQFRAVFNATLYEVATIIDILEAFVGGGSFQISIPIPGRP